MILFNRCTLYFLLLCWWFRGGVGVDDGVDGNDFDDFDDFDGFV